MGTIVKNDSISATLFGKTRREILALLYSHPDESFYLRQIARTADVGMGAVQRELKRLSRAGIIRRTSRGPQVYYQADPECPVYAELKSLIVKTAGVGDVLKAALSPLSDRITVAFVFGSIAQGEERSGSDIDVLVVGDVSFGEVVSALGRVQEMVLREINSLVYPVEEFKSKFNAKDHFLKTVLDDFKYFLIGDEHEFEELAEQRLVEEA